MVWWVAGGVAGTLVLGLVLLIWRSNRAYYAERAAIIDRGRQVYGHIVKAEPGLYKRKARPTFPYAGVVYTFDRTVTNPAQFLREVADCIHAMQDTPDLSAEEKEFLFHLRPGFFGSLHPRRVPARAAGDIAVFLVAVTVTPDRLPAGKLDRPYLYAAAIEGDLTSPVVMLPYPDGEGGAGAE